LTNAIETTVITDICFIPIGGMKRWTDWLFPRLVQSGRLRHLWIIDAWRGK
jgi:hypothetical protein